MARSLRIEYPGAFYHIMARGNCRQAIFLDEHDRSNFVTTLGKACAMTGWRVHAWVLLNNHYHLLVETPEANLVAGMQWLQNSLTRRFNVRHRRWGRVFGDRYKAVLVEGRAGDYYRTMPDYIHLNPVRARLVHVTDNGSVRNYRWSSVAEGYVLQPDKRAKWLTVSDGFAAFGCEDTAAGRRQFVKRLDERALAEGVAKAGIVRMEENADRRCSHLRRGWFWGSREFADEIDDLVRAALAKTKSRAYRSTGACRSHDEREATRMLREGLAAAGLTMDELGDIKGSDWRKVAVAKLLWENTTVSQEWVAERLKMRSAANVSQQLRRARLERRSLPAGLQAYLDQHNRK